MQKLVEDAPPGEGAGLAAVEHDAVLDAIDAEPEILLREDGEDATEVVVREGVERAPDEERPAADRRGAHERAEQIVDGAQERAGEHGDLAEGFGDLGADVGVEIAAGSGAFERLRDAGAGERGDQRATSLDQLVGRAGSRRRTRARPFSRISARITRPRAGPPADVNDGGGPDFRAFVAGRS